MSENVTVSVPVAIDVLAQRSEIPPGAIELAAMESDAHWNEVDLENSNLDFTPPLVPYLAWQAWKTNKKLRTRLLTIAGLELVRVKCRMAMGPNDRPVIAEIVGEEGLGGHR